MAADLKLGGSGLPGSSRRVVAALHEVARQAGADARLEVVAARAELRDVGRVAYEHVAQEHDTRR